MKKIIFLLVLAGQLISSANLQAINGIIGIGYGPRNRAMGGANGAAPVDISTITINPAGLTQLPTSCDLGININNTRSYIDTKHATGVAVNTAAGKQHTVLNYYPFAFAGAVYNPECSRLSFGISTIGVGGGGATYQKPRTNPFLLLEPNGTSTVAETKAIYDTTSGAQILQTGFAGAYLLSDQLSLGASLNTNILFFYSDSLVNTPLGLMQTKGRARLDVSYGLGFTLGGLYTINERLALGATYTSPQWFEQTKLYKDLIPKFRLPQQVRLGLAYRPSCSLLLTMDVKWIGWQTVKLFGRKPINGGLGWQNQYAVGVGLQYSIMPSLIFRAGYNYGKAAINNKVVFANAFIPVTVEHHACIGFELQVNERNSLAISAVYDFRKTMKDNGKGDLVSQLGKGLRMSSQTTDIAFAWNLKL